MITAALLWPDFNPIPVSLLHHWRVMILNHHHCTQHTQTYIHDPASPPLQHQPVYYPSPPRTALREALNSSCTSSRSIRSDARVPIRASAGLSTCRPTAAPLVFRGNSQLPFPYPNPFPNLAQSSRPSVHCASTRHGFGLLLRQPIHCHHALAHFHRLLGWQLSGATRSRTHYHRLQYCTHTMLYVPTHPNATRVRGHMPLKALAAAQGSPGALPDARLAEVHTRSVTNAHQSRARLHHHQLSAQRLRPLQLCIIRPHEAESPSVLPPAGRRASRMAISQAAWPTNHRFCMCAYL